MRHEELFEKRYRGELTPEEAVELKRILAEDEEARRDFVRFTSERSVLMQLAGRLAGQSARRPARKKASPPGWIYGVAAAVLLVGLGVFLSTLSKPVPVRPVAARPDDARRLEREAAEVTARETMARIAAEEEKTRERLAAMERERQRQAEDAVRAEERRKLEAEMARLDARRREAQAELEKARADWLKAQEEAAARKREAEKPAPAAPVAPRETLAAAATLESVEGEVQVGGAPARDGSSVLPGQAVDCPTAASRAALRWADGTRVELAGETSVRDARDHDPKGKGLFVAKGAVAAVVSKQPADRPMVIATPHGEARVVGTTLRVIVAAATRVEVREGRVRVVRSADGRGADVSSGQYALAGPGAPPVARPLFTPRVEETFEALPAWAGTWNAAWGSAAGWSVGPGQGGSALVGTRPSAGSSVVTLVHAVPANARIEVSVAIKCPKFAAPAWAETGFRLGSHAADDFDVNPAQWTLVKRFDSEGGQNGNGNAWAVYSAQVETGAATQLTVGFKLGSKTAAVPAVAWDTLRISW